MPPNPWLLLKYDELNAEQKARLRKALIKREAALAAAMEGLKDAIRELSGSLDQNGQSTFVYKDLRGAARNKPTPRPFPAPSPKKARRKK